MISKYKSAIPFLLVCAMMLYCWGEILFGEYFATWRQWVALVLVAGNAVLYFFRYQLAVWVTGLVLLLATFNLLSFFVVVNTWWMTIFGIETPPIQPWSLLLLVIYAVVNFKTLIEWYLDWMEEPEEKSEQL